MKIYLLAEWSSNQGWSSFGKAYRDIALAETELEKLKTIDTPEYLSWEIEEIELI